MRHIARSSRRHLYQFFLGDSGVATYEAVIWLPIFTFIIWLVTETAMAFGGEAHALRVIQDANRMYATGYFQTVSDTENFIKSQLPNWTSTMTVSTVDSSGVVHTTVTVPVTTMTGFNVIPQFSEIKVSISSEEMLEG